MVYGFPSIGPDGATLFGVGLNLNRSNGYQIGPGCSVEAQGKYNTD